MDDEVDARELYKALCDHDGADAHDVVVAPWLARARGDYRALLATAAGDGAWWSGEGPQGSGYLLQELYALSRVSDLLLLAFQPPADEVPEWPWAHRHGPPDQGPVLSRHEYLDLFTALGMTPFDDTVFDPFLHEIVDVEQVDDPHTPIRITQVVWPGLMLGQLLFSRAGVRVRAGADHAQRGVADRSPLYWTFLRRHRPTVDLSHGWGHNAQWATDFRLDYRTATAQRLNAAGRVGIDGSEDLSPDHPKNLSPEERLLTPDERRELLRHRCLLRVPEAAGALAEVPGWQMDLFPFDWRLPGSQE
ncbi:hypothetical protein ACFTXM_46095 [Streptomyces sp. NPDC056930]|uniref:hypothetical protein n=1 Tax=Streptomyces sp. NPDC056930 TaxID=3345967 RepID=UPI00364187B6